MQPRTQYAFAHVVGLRTIHRALKVLPCRPWPSHDQSWISVPPQMENEHVDAHADGHAHEQRGNLEGDDEGTDGCDITRIALTWISDESSQSGN